MESKRHDTKRNIEDQRLKRRTCSVATAARNALSSIVFSRPGGFSEGPEPDPIPNSAVKLLSADGTKSQGLEE